MLKKVYHRIQILKFIIEVHYCTDISTFVIINVALQLTLIVTELEIYEQYRICITDYITNNKIFQQELEKNTKVFALNSLHYNCNLYFQLNCVMYVVGVQIDAIYTKCSWTT